MARVVHRRAVAKGKFERCVIDVKKTVKPLAGRSVKSSAIAICTKTLGGQPKGLQSRRRRTKKMR